MDMNIAANWLRGLLDTAPAADSKCMPTISLTDPEDDPPLTMPWIDLNDVPSEEGNQPDDPTLTIDVAATLGRVVAEYQAVTSTKECKIRAKAGYSPLGAVTVGIRRTQRKNGRSGDLSPVRRP